MPRSPLQGQPTRPVAAVYALGTRGEAAARLCTAVNSCPVHGLVSLCHLRGAPSRVAIALERVSATVRRGGAPKDNARPSSPTRTGPGSHRTAPVSLVPGIRSGTLAVGYTGTVGKGTAPEHSGVASTTAGEDRGRRRPSGTGLTESGRLGG